MSPVAKRLAVVLPVLLLGAALWWALQGQGDTPDDGGELPGGVVVDKAEPPLPGPAPGSHSAAEVAPVVPLDTGAPAAAEASARPTRERPIFAQGRLVCAAPLDFTRLRLGLIDRDGDQAAAADIAADGSFVVRYGQSLAGGWGLSCDATLVLVDGRQRNLLPAFAGPFAAHAPTQPPVQCELALRFPTRILGVVSVARNGHPLEDAEISVGSSLAAWAFDDDYADTDEGGRYELEVSEVPPTGVLVWCRAWDFQATVVGPFDLPETGDVVLNFGLEKVRPVKGDVVDLATGEPLEGVQVTLGSSHLPFEDDQDWDFTDAKGRFSLDPEDLPLEGAWIHAAGGERHGPAAVRIESRPDERVLLQLPPRAQLVGTVLDSAGLPVDGAEVLVVFQASWFGVDAGLADEAESDADGAFRVELEACVPEQSRLIVSARGYLPFESPLVDVVTYEGGAQVYRVEVRLEAEAPRD